MRHVSFAAKMAERYQFSSNLSEHPVHQGKIGKAVPYRIGCVNVGLNEGAGEKGVA